MFIRFLRDYQAGNGRMYQGGEVIDVDKVWGNALIAEGAAALSTTDAPIATLSIDSAGKSRGLVGSNGAFFEIPIPALASFIDQRDVNTYLPTKELVNIPNPYPLKENAPVHPGILYFPNGWNGYSYWMGFTPYPDYNSVYENPCVVASTNGIEWNAVGRFPLVDRPPAPAYNADTHLFMSPDNVTMYLSYRERGVANKNNVMVMHTTNGVDWTAPVAVATGGTGVQDFASMSIWWNGTGWTMLSHNLDDANKPIQRSVSLSANIYDGFGAPSSLSITPLSGRKWWHSFASRLPTGQVLLLIQDNDGTSGNAGNLFLASSYDDGATFVSPLSLYLVDYPLGGIYRSAFVASVAAGETTFNLFLSDFAEKQIYRMRMKVVSQSVKYEALLANFSASQYLAPLPSNIKWADTFTRADSATLIGNPSGGGSYAVSAGTWGISGNRAYAVANGRVFANSGASDHTVSVVFASLTPSVQQWLVFRAVDATNYWRVGYSGTDLVLQCITGGVSSYALTLGRIANGDLLSAECVGPNLKIKLNGVLVADVYRTAHFTATQFGLQSNVGATSFYKNLTCSVPF